MKYLGPPQSGSHDGLTASRNRNGQYIRTRAIPVNPRSNKQGLVRARLASSAAWWRTLSSDLRAGWGSLASQFHRSDSLGQDYTPTAFQMFCSVNNNNTAAGNAAVQAAPALVTPPSIITATISLTATALSAAYTVTPLGAGCRLFSYASPQRSAGRAFESDLRLLAVSAAAAASPVDLFTAYVSRFGTPVLGNRVFLSFQVYCGGFLSGPLLTSAVVSA
jgi:hypothetical protein